MIPYWNIHYYTFIYVVFVIDKIFKIEDKTRPQRFNSIKCDWMGVNCSKVCLS